MNLPSTFENLIEKANQLGLYKKLINQLNKDFLFANINLNFDEDVPPMSLKLLLHKTLDTLIQEKFGDYLNLIYIIDVSEEKIKQLDKSDSIKLSEQVTFLILLREWQKVWYKSQH